MLEKLFVLNAPMFFENIWEAELSACVDNETMKKVIISPSDSHEDL